MRPQGYIDDGLESRPATWLDVFAVAGVWFVVVLSLLLLLVGLGCLGGRC